MTRAAKRTRIDKAGLRSIAKRQSLSPDTLDSFSRDGLIRLITVRGECDCGCGEGFDGKPEWDHLIPVSIQYEGDAVTWHALRPDCHAIKTRRDIWTAAKTKRMQGLTGQRARRERRGGSSIKSNPKIQGRGFDKTRSRGVDGKVRVREC